MKAHKAKMQENESPEGKKLQNGAGHGADKSIVRTLGKRAIFGNLWGGGPEADPEKAKMQGNEGPQGQNSVEARKYENHSPNQLNERSSRPKRPKRKEIKAQKAKMTGNQGPKSQNEKDEPPGGGARV